MKRKTKSNGVHKLNEAGELQPHELCAHRVSKRTPLTADQRHTVNLVDGAQCTHVGSDGKRCPEKRWLQVHHIVPVSQGGSNDPENLTTLCWHHHDLVHQLSVALEGQVSWLRSPSVEYRVRDADGLGERL